MSDIDNTASIDSKSPTSGRWAEDGLITLVSAAASILVGYIAAFVAANVAGDFRSRVFQK
jgi:hypothetical protein